MPGIATSMPDDDRQATLARWLLPDGAVVAADDPICELQTEKASVEMVAPSPGVLRHLARTGDVVTSAAQIARIDPIP